MGRVDLYLDIAREASRQLEAYQKETTVYMHTAVKHAFVCSTFAAFAVEHKLDELVWHRCFFQTPQPYRRLSLLAARSVRNMPARLEFVKATTGVGEALVNEMKHLLEYRNEIAHCRLSTYEGKVLDLDAPPEELAAVDNEIVEAIMEEGPTALDRFPEVPTKWSRHMDFAAFGSRDMELAPWNLDIAERAVEALAAEIESSEWPTVPPQQSA